MRECGNDLIGALPESARCELEPHTAVVPSQPREYLHRAGEPFDFIYFPHGGIVSMTTPLADGTAVEAAVVGRGGFVGLAAFFGSAPVSPCDAMVQIGEGNLTRLSVETFRAALGNNTAFRDAVAASAHELVTQIMQSTACNARHDVRQRCCRWLLTTADRIDQSSFDLSQEFLASMLGVRRQTVTVIAGELQEQGLVRYSRGHIELLDRDALERTACECYAFLRARTHQPG